MPMDHDPSFVALFVKNQRRIYGYILTVVPDCNEADDLFQQTSLVLWEKADEFRPDGDFVRWACGIAFNVVRNWRVKKRRDRHCFSDEMMAADRGGSRGKVGVARRGAGGLGRLHGGPRAVRPAAAGPLLRRRPLDPRSPKNSAARKCPSTSVCTASARGCWSASSGKPARRRRDERERTAAERESPQERESWLRPRIEQYCDGGLSPEETAELDRRLCDDPEAMESFMLYMALHARIAWNARSRLERGRRKMMNAE